MQTLLETAVELACQRVVFIFDTESAAKLFAIECDKLYPTELGFVGNKHIVTVKLT